MASTLALVIAVSLSPAGEAVAAVAQALYANNAGAVDGISASRTAHAGKLLALNSSTKFPAAVMNYSQLYTRAQGDARYLQVGAAAADANMLDGIDSGGYMQTSWYSGGVAQSGATSATGSPADGCYVGELRLVASNFSPTGTLFAHGQVLPINTNQALFSLLGTTYGGDGQTNFALPNLYGFGPDGTNYVICVAGIFPSPG